MIYVLLAAPCQDARRKAEERSRLLACRLCAMDHRGAKILFFGLLGRQYSFAGHVCRQQFIR